MFTAMRYVVWVLAIGLAVRWWFWHTRAFSDLAQSIRQIDVPQRKHEVDRVIVASAFRLAPALVILSVGSLLVPILESSVGEEVGPSLGSVLALVLFGVGVSVASSVALSALAARAWRFYKPME